MARVIHVTEDVSPSGGGVASALVELTRHLNSPSLPQSVWSAEARRPALPGFPDLQLFPTSKLWRAWRFAPTFRSALDQLGADTLLHLHGVWMAPQYQAAAWALAHGRPWIFSPHNMLTGWFWNQGRLRKVKKLLYWHLRGKQIFRKAAVVHALTTAERNELTRYFPSERIVVIPNGIDLRKADEERGRAAALPKHFPNDEDFFLFLGRLHPVKGLPALIDAFGHLRPHATALWIVGPPVDRAHYEELLTRARRSTVADRIRFLPPVTGESKWAVLARARALCSPSFSEGISMGTLEAMSANTPVIATFQAGPHDIESGGGYLCAPHADALMTVMNRALRWSSAERKRRGEEARRLVESRYSWSVVAPQWRTLYENVRNAVSGRPRRDGALVSGV